MKYRSDFVTNSSSSSFIVTITIKLQNGPDLIFCGMGGSPECGRTNFFDNDALIRVSPKQLCHAKTVAELIQKLTDGILDGDEWDETEPVKIFAKSNPMKMQKWDDDGPTDEYEILDAYTFIQDIVANVHKMEDIKSITILGEEQNYMTYTQSFCYNMETGDYVGIIDGCPFEKDGASGGVMEMPDMDEARIVRLNEDGKNTW